MITVTVPLGDRSYDVMVGSGARHELGAMLGTTYRRAAIITQSSIPWTVDPGIDHEVFTVGDGETHKTMSTIERLCSEMARSGFSRADCIVGVGGGLVTDIAGFVAATYHRGIDVFHVSTSLLGQIDAAIGGKTGVNLPEGKNLVGAYWQPHGVLCDTETLSTLPPEELRCGLGELAKYHWLGGENLDDLDLDERVARCVEIKASIVSQDEREGGKRALLNYGHTLAHAIEIAGGHDLRHGEAVAIGLVYAAEVALRLGRISEADVAEHRRVIAKYDLAGSIPAHLDDEELIHLMSRDKKATTVMTFVLDSERGVEVVEGIAPDVLKDALKALR